VGEKSRPSVSPRRQTHLAALGVCPPSPRRLTAVVLLVAAVGGGAALILRGGRPRPPVQSAPAQNASSADAQLAHLRQAAAGGDADACIALGNAFA
jgi:hypothetical protein